MASQDRTLESEKVGTVTEMFPYRMPFRVARVISALLALIFAAALAASIYVEFPEHVTAPFVLVPEASADPIQSPFEGVVEEVFAAEQGIIDAGAVLFTIRSPRIQDLYAELRTVDEELAAISARRESTTHAYGINQDVHRAELDQIQREASYQREYLTIYQDVQDRFEKLGREGLTSSVELLELRLGLAAAERDAAVAAEQVKMTQLLGTRMDATHEVALMEFTTNENKLRVRRENLAAQLQNTTGDTVSITAPYDGMILSVARRRPGDVVAVGQELCHIAPLTGQSRAKLELPEPGMGRLREGQPVKLLFAAFPYQRYGVVDGTLHWISPAPVTSVDHEAFIAYALPEDLVIGNGALERPLRAGMTGEARIQSGRRTLIEYAFEPLRQLRENMRNQKHPDLAD